VFSLPSAKITSPIFRYLVAEGVSTSYDALLELFECIGNFLKRLEIYTNISLSPLMMEIIVADDSSLRQAIDVETKRNAGSSRQKIQA
jgi:hypothetical protein